MNSTLLPNIIRFVVFIAIQTIILQQISFSQGFLGYISFLLYPLFLFLLPLRTPGIVLVIVGFLLGIAIDTGYNSPGVHAATSLTTVILRPLVLSILEPREGYNVNQGLTIRNYGYGWFIRYAGVLLFIHLFIYFSLEVFTPVYFLEILFRTILSFIFSMILILAYMTLFQPRN